MIPHRLTRSAALLVVPLLLAGCNTTKTTTAGEPAGDYVYVSETGSNIPRKVRKGSTTDGSLPVEKGDGRTLEQLQRDQTIRNMRRDGT